MSDDIKELKGVSVKWYAYGIAREADGELEALVAERDRLRAALQDCVDAYDFVVEDEYDRGWSSVSDAIHAARKALEAKE